MKHISTNEWQMLDEGIFIYEIQDNGPSAGNFAVRIIVDRSNVSYTDFRTLDQAKECAQARAKDYDFPIYIVESVQKCATPAPWGAEFSASERCWQIVHLPSDDVLCLVNTDIESHRPDHDGGANAQLIAAAPELLAVAEQYAHTLTLARLVLLASNDAEALSQMDANLIRARAVIAKAKGETL